ncbi:MAG: hypothetical protein JNL05_13150 [Flavobacteriales bacterium]|nr:hypothetical protein [Flavobacteriales bacterium]
MKNVPLFVTLAAIGGLVIAMVHLGRLEARVNELAAKGGTAPVAEPEVAVHMARIQVYMDKLYWAGMAGNRELADFYRHEIKEVMEVVAGAGIVEDGIDVSANMRTIGIQAIDAMKMHLKEKGLDGFRDQYGALVVACNGCHAASAHAMIRVQEPTENRFTGQAFTP